MSGPEQGQAFSKLTTEELQAAASKVTRQMERDSVRDYDQFGPCVVSAASKRTVKAWQALDAELKRRREALPAPAEDGDTWTAPTLPDLLTRAARLMPERFSFHDNDGGGYFASKYKGHEYYAYWLSGSCGDWEDDLKPPVLEYTCREEAEARGWNWTLRTWTHGRTYTAQLHTPVMGEACVAPTPAQALLAALVIAVEAEEGEG